MPWVRLALSLGKGLSKVWKSFGEKRVERLGEKWQNGWKTLLQHFGKIRVANPSLIYMRRKLRLGFVFQNINSSGCFLEFHNFSWNLIIFCLDESNKDDPLLSLKRKWKWFVADAIEDTIPVQDTIHEGAKLRVRLLKRERFKFLPLGNTIASCTHLEELLGKVSKDKHLLKSGDLNLSDKMNYDAVERLCNPNVAELLERHVPSN